MAIQTRLLTKVLEDVQKMLFDDGEKIQCFVMNTGVTQCPPAYAAAVNGAEELEPLPHYERKKGRFF